MSQDLDLKGGSIAEEKAVTLCGQVPSALGSVPPSPFTSLSVGSVCCWKGGAVFDDLRDTFSLC